MSVVRALCRSMVGFPKWMGSLGQFVLESMGIPLMDGLPLDGSTSLASSVRTLSVVLSIATVSVML